MIADELRQNLDETLTIKETRQPIVHIVYLTSRKRFPREELTF